MPLQGAVFAARSCARRAGPSLRRRALAVLLGLVVLPCFASIGIVRFTPQGSVKDVRQVTAVFSAPVVRFGDPRLPDPFRVDCPAAGQGRWADTRSWVYDFQEDLPAGLHCRFSLVPGLHSTSGDAVAVTPPFEFDTGGPSVRASLPHADDSQVDEQQVFLLKLDTAVDEASVRAHAYCVVKGLSERIPVDIITGSQRRLLLDQRKALGYEYFEILWKSGRRSFAQAKGHSMEAEESLVLPVRCARDLPPATEVQLVWGAGIRSRTGLATTQDQTLGFTTRPAFTATFSCQRVNAHSACLPMTPMTLTFSAPISRALAAKIRMHDGWREYPARLGEDGPVDEITFDGPFPEKASLQIELPPGLVDDAGRALANASRFPLEVGTAEAPPLVKFAAPFGILERSEGGVLPITLRNVEAGLPTQKSRVASAPLDGGSKRIDDDASILHWMQRVDKAMEPSGRWDETTKRWHETTGEASVFAAEPADESFTLPKPHGPQPFEVIGLPLKNPGFYVVEIKSPRLGAALLGDERPRYVAATALVTNLAVHLKLGRESSLVFVTRLDSAAPVAGASVRIGDGCLGERIWSGQTDAHGIARIDTELPEHGSSCQWGPHPLIASARLGDDMSFTLSTWDRGIEPSDFHLPISPYDNPRPLMVHSVLDRMLFRAGETVSMKHFARLHTAQGFAAASALPAKLVLRHQGSDQRYELPLTWASGGIAESRWEIPKDCKLGTYRITMPAPDGNGEIDTGSLRVEQYRVPSMHAIIQGPKGPVVAAGALPLDLFISYLSGGGAGYLPVKLRTQLAPRSVSFEGYEDYRFGGDEIHEGVTGESGHGYLGDDENVEDNAEEPADAGGPVQVLPLTLDAHGALRAAVDKLPLSASPKDLVTELEYQDASGQTLSAAARIPMWPASVVLGLRPEGWVATKDDLRFKVAALDLHGHPLAGRDVSVDFYQRITHSYRRRLVGGFYTYDHADEVRRIGTACAGRTDEHGLLSCQAASKVSGQVLLQAVARDDAGNRALSSTEMWVAGEDDWWFAAAPSDRMDVLPEKPRYEVGDTARFQVRMPFRSATALVTVEREGVIESSVQTLSGKEPVIELPISAHDSPNIYVSVLAVRGRIGLWRSRLADLVHWLHLPLHLEGGTPTALVDLSKPAYRLGIAHVNVGWQPHQLQVKVTPAQEVFHVRDTAHVSISVRPATGAPLAAGAEVALAAVDEGLLDLMPNPSWNLLDAMMTARGLEVETSTAQMEVVGKRHYGRKAGAPGGGGGRAPARELFDTLLLWKGRVALDARGQAAVDIPLNDSLSAFRIVAIASAGDGWFGTGSATIRTSQDLQLLSGLPSIVREGDHVVATVTLRNAATRAMSVEISARATPRAGDVAAPVLAPQVVEVAAGSAREVAWPIAVPYDAGALQWDWLARDRAGPAADHLRIVEPVIAAVPVRTYQATIMAVDGQASVPVELPAGSLPGRGGIHVDLLARLGDRLDGVTEYMQRYPYTCFEQRVSQAVALGDDALWRADMSLLPAFLDGDGLLRYFPAEWLEGSDTLTAYVLSIAQEAGLIIPDAPLRRMLGALDAFVAGRIVRRSEVTMADLTLRKLAAIAALARYDKADPAMLGSITIDPNLWPTSAVLDWIDILHRVADVPEHDARLAQAMQILRSRLNFQGTTLGFSTEKDDALWWLMLSADTNAAHAILATLEDPAWRDDMPRLVRGALGRQLHGHWNTTVANAWGVVALHRFSQRFEAAPVTGTTRLDLASARREVTWEAPASAVDLPWPAGAGTLQVTHAGSGRPWAVVASRAALPAQTLSTGYRVQRSVTAVSRQRADHLSRGDVLRVHLDLEAQSDMTWVVVDDPIPAGASIEGSGLGGSSQMLTLGEHREGDAWLAFVERRADAYRGYFAFVPKGKWSVEYTVRLNSAGDFLLPATRVEAMYAPEMLGELANSALRIDGP